MSAVPIATAAMTRKIKRLSSGPIAQTLLLCRGIRATSPHSNHPNVLSCKFNALRPPESHGDSSAHYSQVVSKPLVAELLRVSARAITLVMALAGHAE